VWALGLAIMVWGTGSFAFVSNQQARLANTAPALASASLSLNTSSLYAGQALGAALGGLMLGWVGFTGLAPVGAAVVGLALAVSVWADRQRQF
jgi:predicted MFS family arabinose efflux permease